MSDAVLAILLVVMALLAAVVLAAVGWWAFSRFGGQSRPGSPPMVCGYRADTAGSWTVGTLHYEDDLLVHRGPEDGGVSLLTQHRWSRVGLDLGVAEHVRGAEVSSRLPDVPLMAVPCSYGRTRFFLALPEEHYTALRSWVEAAPPGWNTSVA